MYPKKLLQQSPRTDPARNMARFYRLDVQPTLFGEYALVREWGRIGSGGRVRSTPYSTPDAALAALARQRQVKERRGYHGKANPAPELSGN